MIAWLASSGSLLLSLFGIVKYIHGWAANREAEHAKAADEHIIEVIKNWADMDGPHGGITWFRRYLRDRFEEL